ncbi:MAG TPA: permease-like cell division protein FtsX [Longimicrobiales bacterium]|nr:permease-like cell division protein FtsX [Longimicrobiales bacterium]
MNHSVREAMAGFRRAPVLTGLAAAMVGLALFVLGLFGLAAHNLQVALDQLEERVEVVVYLREGTRSRDVDEATAQLAAMAPVAEVRHVSKAEALEKAREELPEFGEVFTDLSVNPLPASLEVRLLEGSRTEENVESVAQVARAFPFVEEVTYGREWVERLFSLRRLAGAGVTAFAVALAVVAALIIGAAIRVAIFARRDEIYVMRLVGAKDGFIRRPFLLEGATAGFVGGVLAVALTFFVFRLSYRFLFQMSWIPLSWILAVLTAGIVLGVVSSALSVHRHLREV